MEDNIFVVFLVVFAICFAINLPFHVMESRAEKQKKLLKDHPELLKKDLRPESVTKQEEQSTKPEPKKQPDPSREETSFNSNLTLVQEGKRWGVVNDRGETVVPCEYLSVKLLEGKYLYASSYYGVVYDLDGKELLPRVTAYDYTRSGGIFVVRYQRQYGYVDLERGIHSEERWDDAKPMIDGRAAVKRDGKWGMINRDFRLITPCKWDSTARDDNGQYLLYRGNQPASITDLGEPRWGRLIQDQLGEWGVARYCIHDKWGLMDRSGDPVGEARWEDMNPFFEGLAAVYDGQHWGFVDTRGELRIACRFSSPRFFQNGKCWVKERGTPVFIDPNGVIVGFHEDKRFCDGLARCACDGKVGFEDRSGLMVIPCVWDNAYDFNEQRAAVCRDGKWGFIDKQGREVVPCQYEDAWRYQEGFAPVKRDGLWGYIDKNGELLTGFFWEKAGFFRKGKACVEAYDTKARVNADGTIQWDAESFFTAGARVVYRGGKRAILRRDGKLMTPFAFDCLLLSPWGVVCVKEKLWGVWKDEMVIPCKYENLALIGEGCVKFQRGRLWGVMDFQERETVPCVWDDILCLDSGIISARRDGQVFHLNHQGEILPRPFECIRQYKEGLAAVKRDGKWGFIDADGDLVIDCQWDRVNYLFSQGTAVVAVAEPREDGGTHYRNVFIDRTGRPVR